MFPIFFINKGAPKSNEIDQDDHFLTGVGSNYIFANYHISEATYRNEGYFVKIMDISSDGNNCALSYSYKNITSLESIFDYIFVSFDS